jgi:RNase P protein component
MQSDDRTFAEKTLGKPEPTDKLHQHRLVKFCLDVATNNDFPDEVRNRAKKLVSEWIKLPLRSPATNARAIINLQNISHSSLKEQQTKAKELEALIKRMERFRNETQ